MIINGHRLFNGASVLPACRGDAARAASQANRHLAELRGWRNITEAGGTLLGTPPTGAGNSRGQAAVPNWCGDWAQCAPLLAEYRIALAPMTTCATAGGVLVRHIDHADPDAALRHAIVLAAIVALRKK